MPDHDRFTTVRIGSNRGVRVVLVAAVLIAGIAAATSRANGVECMPDGISEPRERIDVEQREISVPPSEQQDYHEELLDVLSKPVSSGAVVGLTTTVETGDEEPPEVHETLRQRVCTPRK